MGEFYACQLSIIMGIKVTGAVFVSSGFPKEKEEV